MERYNHLNKYLIEKFGSRTLKICVDGGFSCPNRDGVKSTFGCIFCGGGAGENIVGKKSDVTASIKSQVTQFLSSYRGLRADKFIVYFQSFSGTYADVDTLKVRYDTALASSDKIVGLQVATRPDLVSLEVVDLLASYKDKYYVCVELGLQTKSDDIGSDINRCYTSSEFENACKLLKSKGIDVVAHLMVGLPNQDLTEVLNTVDFLNRCGINGLKIHNTYVQTNTVLADRYQSGEYVPITQEYYVDAVCRILGRLNSDIIIHRITADPPKGECLAPMWCTHKKLVLNAINKKLDEMQISQGCDLQD